jgi:hypothetical protein
MIAFATMALGSGLRWFLCDRNARRLEHRLNAVPKLPKLGLIAILKDLVEPTDAVVVRSWGRACGVGGSCVFECVPLRCGAPGRGPLPSSSTSLCQ